NGIPGFAEVPLAKYLFSDQSKEVVDQEILIVLTPHIIRLPSISMDDLRTMAAGTDTNVRVFKDDSDSANMPVPKPGQAGAQTMPNQAPSNQVPARAPTPPGMAAQLRFDPPTVRLKSGDRTTVGLAVNNVNDLYSIPLL